MKAISESGLLRCQTALGRSAQFCAHLVSAPGELKARLHEKFTDLYPEKRHLISQALADAEELAWRTPFPHLFLPDFAELRLAEIVSDRKQRFALTA